MAHVKWVRRRIRNDNSWNKHYENRWHHRQVSKGTRKQFRLELRDWEIEYGYGGVRDDDAMGETDVSHSG